MLIVICIHFLDVFVVTIMVWMALVYRFTGFDFVDWLLLCVCGWIAFCCLLDCYGVCLLVFVLLLCLVSLYFMCFCVLLLVCSWVFSLGFGFGS